MITTCTQHSDPPFWFVLTMNCVFVGAFLYNVKGKK